MPEEDKYEELGRKNFEDLKKKYPKAKVGVFKLGEAKQDAYLVHAGNKNEMIRKVVTEKDDDVAKLGLMFIEWFANRRLKSNQEEIAEAQDTFREKIYRDIGKFEALFEFIECSLIEHAILTKIFRLFDFDGDKIEKNKQFHEENGRRIEEGERNSV